MLFSFSINFHLTGCGGQLIATDTNQYISSPNFPQNYPTLIACRWEITAPRKDLRISLNFLSFDLESDDQCRYDFLRVTRGSTNPPLGICGKPSKVPTVHSDGDKMIIEFQSDYAVGRSGFNASFTSGNTFCCNKSTISYFI